MGGSHRHQQRGAVLLLRRGPLPDRCHAADRRGQLPQVAPAAGARWATGDATGLRFPADPDTLRLGGIRFLTEAFQAFGALRDDNEVVAVTRCDDVAGGSTGRKASLTVRYRTPGPHRELFVKFSRDFDCPERDHGRTQMAQESAFAAAARAADLPVAVPSVMFTDYHRASGTGVLITERIAFGRNGIERQYEKCADYQMPDQLGHYRAVLRAVAAVAGLHASGRLPVEMQPNYGPDARQPVSDRARLLRRLDRLGDFATACPGLLPAAVRSPEYLAGLSAVLPRLLECEPAVWRTLHDRTEFTALCHWNANVDNAWFWRDADDVLQCGLMDWGSVGPMNVAMAIWGALCSAETDLWDRHFVGLVRTFADEFTARGGPPLDVDELIRHVVSYASIMGVTWLLDAPAHVRSQVPGLTASSTRMDPAISGVESVRCRLQMLTNVLNVWRTYDLDAVLDEVLDGIAPSVPPATPPPEPPPYSAR